MENKYTDDEWNQVISLVVNFYPLTENLNLDLKSVKKFSSTEALYRVTSEKILKLNDKAKKSWSKKIIWFYKNLDRALFSPLNEVPLLINVIPFKELANWRLDHGK